MPYEITQRVVSLNVTITLPVEHAYTDEELAEILVIKSPYKEIKVLGVIASEEVSE